MKINWVTYTDASWMDPLIQYLEDLGHTVIKNQLGHGRNEVQRLDESFDVLFGATIGVQRLTRALHDDCPNVPMVNYNWDVYEWAYKNHGHGTTIFPYDLNLYEKLLQDSKFVACPSWSVVYRNEEFFDIPREKSVIVKSFARQISIDPSRVRDDRFIYMPLRQIPDRNKGWFEKACDELNIPYRVSDKHLSEEEYADTIASCSFLVCPWYEASTGGLSLIEGMSIGKPVLFSDSKYMGAEDYLGNYATKFKHDDYEDFKLKIKSLWENPSTVTFEKGFIDYYKPKRMAEDLLRLFEKCL